MTKRLGSYVLGEEIERRALTITCRAEHADMGRPAWIKMLKPTVSASSPYALELERQAQILGRLSHEGILRVYDLVRADDRIWLVLEEPPGVPLAEVVAKLPPPHRLPVDVAVGIGVLVAGALAHAHERGVVHRELSPELIWIGEGGEVKLTGFSAAHDASVPSSPVPFEAAETFGRPDYFSPEQVLGEGTTPQSDVYALGAVLYALIAGRPPFSSADGKDVAHRIRSETPPSLRELVGPSVPAELDAVVMRALAKHPEDRFANAGRLRDALAPLVPVEMTAVALAGRARSLAGLSAERDLPAPEPPAALVPRADLWPVWGRLFGVLVGVVLGGAAIQWATHDPDDAGALGAPAGTGYVRPLARPWAEVFIDGEHVDTTPIGIPIPVPAGRHHVTFRHPQAPDEQRTIRVENGQTIVVDVIMRVARDAGAPPPGPDPEDSP